MICILINIYIYISSTLGFLWEASENSKDFALSGGTAHSYLGGVGLGLTYKSRCILGEPYQYIFVEIYGRIISQINMVAS